MLLLDIILDPRRIKDTARVIKPVVRDTVSAPSDSATADTVASTFNVRSAFEMASFLRGPVIAILIIFLCFKIIILRLLYHPPVLQ